MGNFPTEGVLKYGLTGLLLRLRLRLPPTTTPLAGAPVHRRPIRAFGASGARDRKVTLPVIPKICPLCKRQSESKLASLYWAWVRADGRRKAFKQKVCADCMREHYVPLIVASMEPVLICPSCGIGTVDDYDAVYLTYCMPGMPKDQSEMPLCGACAVSVRNKALEGSSELDDRGVGVGGPRQEAPSASEAWAALGLRPR